ncbi:hypothetical protein VPHD81_0036 [Vibrio phage D81]
MLVLNRKSQQKVCIGIGLKQPNDKPEYVVTVIDVNSPYTRIEVEHLGVSRTHNLVPLETVRLNDVIVMQVTSINFKEVKLAFDAPKDYRILRGEL